MISEKDFQDFFKWYVGAALWSSLDNDKYEADGTEEFLDANYDVEDLDPATREKMMTDCRKFIEKYGHLFTVDNLTDKGYSPFESAGYDLWMSRNGHGCGFMDDWKEPVASTLHDAVGFRTEFPEVYLYAENGKVYQE